ncbi:MAG: DUF1003 domain-containing protein [Armatimonadetes bacterium]|nr:DUF1003 domain-containing protein [Armatimonadota bacterium]MDW8154384.1 DUF1003 domain-containing protein [Armatimonadota bacterium]
MIGEIFLRRFRDEVQLVEHVLADGTRRLVPHWTHAHPPVRDVNRELRERFTPLERLALTVTTRVGSPGFFLIIAAWTVGWLLWNTLGPRKLRFDPAPAFVLWLFISNMIQILLMPLIMVGQNLLNRHSELRAEADFEINQKAEREVEAILLHLEHQTAAIEHQNELILRVLHYLEKRVSPGGPEGGVNPNG